MSATSYEDFVIYASEAIPASWRVGQAHFNRLCDVRPDLSERIRGVTGLDPFYRDDCVPTFWAFVEDNW